MIKVFRGFQPFWREFSERRLQLFGVLAQVVFLVTSCASTSAVSSLQVDGQKALEHTSRIVEFGPRPPGSDAQRQVGDYLIGQLESFGLKVVTDAFEPLTPIGRLQMRNIRGVSEGNPESVIILASHYDSKLYENFTFVGANDGASSSGLLLELARVLAQENPLESTLWFSFFDGEEAINTWTDQDSLYGSRHLVQQLTDSGDLEKVKALVLLDLIGGKDLVLLRDLSSTDWMNRLFWSKAASLGHQDIFRLQGTTAATDDHIPFSRAGIPVIDIIDLQYDQWHSEADTLDKISSRSLQVVGDVVLATLPDLEKRLGSARE